MIYEKLMSPFILVYHGVRWIFNLPLTILKYAYDGILVVIDTIYNLFRGKDKVPISVGSHESQAKQNGPVNVLLDQKQLDSEKLVGFNYTVKSGNGQIVKGVFDAHNIKEVEEFLINEGYQIVTIEPRKAYDIDLFVITKLKAGELSFVLTQISTYLKAGIPLIDAVRILSKQTENKNKRKVYQKIVYELLKGENFSDALARQGNTFPKLLINMVKTAEKTGDLSGTLDDMSDYYKAMDETRKQMISAMTYPTIILIFAVLVVGFILAVVVPNFVKMFANQNAELPQITVIIIGVSNFIKNQYFWIVFVLVALLVIYRGLYTNIKGFRKAMQTFYMKMPVIGKILIYNEVTNFTKTFSSLLNHGVFITDSMDILSTITNNEVYKDIISKTLNNLSKGAKISEAFRDQWAFPVVAYEMLITGENTGQLGMMMEKVAEHYQTLHKTSVTQIKSLVEPIMIAILAFLVGIIILAVIIPMFSIYQSI